MRITLNLATRPFSDLGPAIKRLRIAMGVLAGVSILLAIGLHLVHHSAELARQKERELDGRIARVTGERQQYVSMMHQPKNAALLEQVGMLNALFDEKLFSWTLAMEDLETVLPGGVQVSSLEPVRAKDGVITLHLRVIGPRDREVELVQNLEHSKRFLAPRIVGENAESNEGQGGNHELEPVSASNRFNFDLLAEYNPTTLGELTEEERKTAASDRQAARQGVQGTAMPAVAPGPRPAMAPRMRQREAPATMAQPAQRPTYGGPRQLPPRQNAAPPQETPQ